jgi:hypothetical protein
MHGHERHFRIVVQSIPIADMLCKRLALRYARSSAAKKKSKGATQVSSGVEREERERSRTQQFRCRRLMRIYHVAQGLGAQIVRIQQSAALAF